MNHKWTAALAAVLLAGSAGGAWGQEMAGGGGFRAGRLDLGVYAGGSLTSDWFNSRTITLDGTPTGADNDDDQGYAPGYAPVFGAFATYWLAPALGVRLNGSYTPMRLPFASTGFFDVSPDGGAGPTGRGAYVLNTYFYDLDLVLRPVAGRAGAGIWRGVYLFAGGGGMTVNLAGENRAQCQATLLAAGACLSGEPMQATVGQGTAGVGMDLLWLGRSLALFGELGAHVYDSPVHVGDDFIGPATGLVGSTVRIADDRTAVTGRLVAGLKLVLGDILPRRERTVVIAVPAPPEPPKPEPEPPTVRFCVVANGSMSEVTGQLGAQGDTTVNGVPVSQAYPETTGYVAAEPWFVNKARITFNDTVYVQFKQPRIVAPGDLTRIGEYQGVSVFGPTGTPAPEDVGVIYLPVRRGCEFQPYQVYTKAAEIRG